MQTLVRPTVLPVSMYRLVDSQPDSTPYEGSHRTTTGVKIEEHEWAFPAGSVRVSTDQPLGDLAVVMLEPESVIRSSHGVSFRRSSNAPSISKVTSLPRWRRRCWRTTPD